MYIGRTASIMQRFTYIRNLYKNKSNAYQEEKKYKIEKVGKIQVMKEVVLYTETFYFVT